MESLREHVMINKFVSVAGCAREQAEQLLQSTHWQLETALSIFFQDSPLPVYQHPTANIGVMITPCNTPSTPPNFPDTLIAFSRMTANDKVNSSSPSATRQEWKNEQSTLSSSPKQYSPLQQQKLHHQQPVLPESANTQTAMPHFIESLAEAPKSHIPIPDTVLSNR